MSESDDWTGWRVFFLDAIATQAKENNAKAGRVYELYRDTLEFLMTVARTDNAAAVAPHLFRRAIFPTSVFTKDIGLSKSTAKRLVRVLKKHEFVVEVLPHIGSTPAVLALPKLLAAVEGVGITMGH